MPAFLKRGRGKPKLVLHIGRQKTGTTSVQRFLAANTEQLKAAGVLYPCAGRNEGQHAAHHQLAIALNEGESQGEQLAELKACWQRELAANKPELVVFSSEAFQRIRDPARLREFFDDANIHAVCYLRECLAAKQSSWAQSVHASGQSAHFVDFATNSRLGYRGFVANWKRWSAQLDLALFERQRLEGGDVVLDFLHRIGCADLAARCADLPRDDGLPSLGGNLLHLRHVMNLARAGAEDIRGTFEALSALAASEPRWRGRWQVPERDRALIAKVDRDDARFLESLFGAPRAVDFDALPPAPDHSTLRADVQTILSDPIISAGFQALGYRQ